MSQYTEKAMVLQRWSEWCEYHRCDEMKFRNGSTIRFSGSGQSEQHRGCDSHLFVFPDDTGDDKED